MSPVFDRRALRKRWFHMPAFAVIATAATLAYLGEEAISAWRTSKAPRPESGMMTVIGKAAVTHVAPDHIAWSMAVTVSSKAKADVERVLADKTRAAVQELLEQGVSPSELRVASPTVEERTAESSDPYSDNPPPAVVLGYDGSQTIEIQSPRVAASLEAYTKISMQPRTWLSVEPPQCWLESSASLRRKLQDAAWADLRDQLENVNVRLRGQRLGRGMAVSQTDLDLSSERATWACSEGQTARVNVVVNYELR